jgi:hypothetical protein
MQCILAFDVNRLDEPYWPDTQALSVEGVTFIAFVVFAAPADIFVDTVVEDVVCEPVATTYTIPAITASDAAPSTSNSPAFACPLNIMTYKISLKRFLCLISLPSCRDETR